MSTTTSHLAPSTIPTRVTMNGKPVIVRENARTVLNLHAGEFQEKLLCDGITYNPGDACAFSCEFCYVKSVMWKLDSELIAEFNHRTQQNLKFHEVVIRRKNVTALIEEQLLRSNKTARFDDPSDQRMVFGSTSVDVAANLDLLKETAEACLLMFKHTNWHVRLLSKSSLLNRLIKDLLIPSEYHHRLVLGFSTGTLDDKVARAIEGGTPPVSKRLESLHWLQDRGCRTFGMICPSLPQADFDKFSHDICDAIRADRCEHVWAEVINLRGESFKRTIKSLETAGLHQEATSILAISGSNHQTWENYARATFLAHSKNIPPAKLRFLQYIDESSATWWAAQRPKGAILLGATAKEKGLTVLTGPQALPSAVVGTKPATTTLTVATPNSVVPAAATQFAVATAKTTAPTLSKSDLQHRAKLEMVVTKGVRATIIAARALHEIFSFKQGAMWNCDYHSFEAYCRAKWGYSKAHSYRLVHSGEFLSILKAQSPNGDCLPRTEAQIRPILHLNQPNQVPAWQAIVAKKNPSELTEKAVAQEVRDYARSRGLNLRKKTKPQHSQVEIAKNTLQKLKAATATLPQAAMIASLLQQVTKLLV